MATKIVMPDLGESVIEGRIVRWMNVVGDLVRAGEPLIEVDTDKVTTQIVSPIDGVLLTIAAVRDATVEVGALLGLVGSAGEQVPADEQVPAETRPPKPIKSSQRFVSPVVARMVAHHNLDLSNITGTGKNGRVRKKDVLAYLNQPTPALPSFPQAKVATPPASLSATSDLLPLTATRRAIARRMMHSKQTIPHVTAVVEVDLQQVTAHRKAHKEAFARDGVKLTYMAYFVVAVAQALKTHRIVNSSWSDEGIVLHRAVNIGMATDLGERGLIVPVVRNSADLSLLGAARAIGDLAEKARAGTLRLEDTRGATYTITNYGSNGSLQATPIISPPQCAIFGVGKIERRPVVRVFAGEEVVVIRPMVYITHTYDHRILDGGTSARFLRDVIATIEHWDRANSTG